MRFIADGMLGKLARWLRLLGCDVEYFKNISDERLIEEAKETNRILLTCDLQLYKRAVSKRVEAFIVEGKNQPEKLANMSRRFNFPLKINVEVSRCPTCNSKIRRVDKKEIEGKVPSTTFKRYRRFWMCDGYGCGKIYWQGGHWNKIHEILREANKYLK
jgi:uncharacterized protein with PIN domain